jgi:hypothetical protein
MKIAPQKNVGRGNGFVILDFFFANIALIIK